MNNKVATILSGGLLLASRLVEDLRTPKHQPQSPSPMDPDDSPTPDIATIPSATDTPTTTFEQAPPVAPTDTYPEAPSDNNPLKRFQDLINSPTTPDGHKVVAAVAAASTVTVAAVANWLIKATRK